MATFDQVENHQEKHAPHELARRRAHKQLVMQLLDIQIFLGAAKSGFDVGPNVETTLNCNANFVKNCL